jgi:hypothetical protein
METTCSIFAVTHTDTMKRWIANREDEGYVFHSAVGSNDTVTVFMVLDLRPAFSDEGNNETEEVA